MELYTFLEREDFTLVENDDGKTLGVSKEGVERLLYVDGYAFKDLNNNGKLDPYEDWRLDDETRIADLVKQLSIEEIAGLMLYSKHQSVSSAKNPFSKMWAGTYNGKTLEESGCQVYELTDQQKQFLEEEYGRHVLVTVVDDAKTSAMWNNQLQAHAEVRGHGIPVNICSDPRHGPSGNAEFNAGSGGHISMWPESLGLAATFDPEVTRQFGQIAASEYRRMGITTALSPQIDLATDPRWMRFNGTFGEDTQLATEMADAYCDGMQSPYGWSNQSVNAMAKHWPGGGTGEGGRDGHFGYGKYSVYPKNQLFEQMKPFTQGALNLRGLTRQASAIMPCYEILFGQESEGVGAGYSSYLIDELLRTQQNYDGVICTDWSITHDNHAIDQFISGKCWGVEEDSIAMRHYKVLMAGCDQFGGNNEVQPVLDAYKIGCEKHGEAFMRQKFEASAARILRNMMRVGLFENPYVEAKNSGRIVGSRGYMQLGYQAQLRSIVMLKNKGNVLPMEKGKKVYIPSRRLNDKANWFGHVIAAHEENPIADEIVSKYYTRVNHPEEADFALVMIESPDSVGYTKENEYQPITLQYKPYTATTARNEAIAGGKERSYLGKSNTPSNTQDLDIVLETRKAMGDKPVIVVLKQNNPTIVSEFESQVDAIVIHFNVQNQAVLDIVSGMCEPSGLLPFQMPKNMETVEMQAEDLGHDMECYQDECGNIYDFAFGMNYQGVIDDDRVKKYKK